MLVQAFTGLPGGGENVTAGVVDGLAGMAQFFDHLAPGLGHMLQRLHQAGVLAIGGREVEFTSGQAAGEGAHVARFTTQWAHHAAAHQPGGGGHRDHGEEAEQEHLPHQLAHRRQGLLLVHLGDQGPMVAGKLQRHEDFEGRIAVQSGLFQAPLLAGEGAADGVGRECRGWAEAAIDLQFGEAHRVRAQTAVAAHQVGFTLFAKSLAGLHDGIEWGNGQLQHQGHLQLIVAADWGRQVLGWCLAEFVVEQVTD